MQCRRLETMERKMDRMRIVVKLHELASDIHTIACLFDENYAPNLLKHIERWRKKLDSIERWWRRWQSR